MAEIPGLIEGAHLGKGLGIDFLRHAMRTKILIHLISGDSPTPTEDMLKVNNELAMFDPSLAKKPQIVALNKIDLPEVQEKLPEIKEELSGAGIKAHYISAATGQGVDGLMEEALKLLKAETAAAKRPEPPVRYSGRSRGKPALKSSGKAGSMLSMRPGLDRLIAGSGVTPGELRWQLNFQLEKMGVNKILEKAGVQDGR